jgi:peroxiredoxin Q/BCP
LACLRDEYTEFTSRGAEILAIGPDKPSSFVNYWRENNIPFVGLPDVGKTVSKLYKQEVNLFKLGRMPMNSIVDREGRIRFVHYGMSMADIPDNETFIQVIEKTNIPSE